MSSFPTWRTRPHSVCRPATQSDFGYQTAGQFDGDCPVAILNGFPGADYENVCQTLIASSNGKDGDLFDLCYTENLNNPFKPIWLRLQPGSGFEFCEMVGELLKLMSHHLDAERLVTRIIRKQNNDPKIVDFLSDLAAHVAQGLEFQHPVLINLLIHHEDQQAPVVYGRDLNWDTLFGSINYQTEQGSVTPTSTFGTWSAAGSQRWLPDTSSSMSCWISLISGSKLKTPCKRRAGLECLSGRQDADAVLHPGSDPIRFKLILVGDRLDVAEFQMLDRGHGGAHLPACRSGLRSEHRGRSPRLPAISRLAASALGAAGFQKCLLALCRHASRLCDHQGGYPSPRYSSAPSCAWPTAWPASWKRPASLTNISCSPGRAGLPPSTIWWSNRIRGVIDGQILLQTDGEEVGQINGLSVIQVAGHPYDFGEPVRLTATVHLGDGDVADIERKAELAGHIHAKAMMIIHGYLSNKFGAENPRRSRPTWCSSSHTTDRW